MSGLTEIQIAYVNNDNKIGIKGLQADSVQSGSPLNTASVTVVVVVSGTTSQVGGVSWPIALSLVTSGSGSGEEVRGSRWEGTLPDSLGFVNGEYYQAEVLATAGEGFKGFWSIPIRGRIRES